MDIENTIKSELIYSGQLLELRRDIISTTSGKSFREVIRHPGASVIIPYTSNNKIIFVKQFRYAISNFLIELPAGLIEKNESHKDTAQRELREETGYSAKKLSNIGKFWTAPGFCDELIHVYLAEDLIYDPLPSDLDEDIETIEIELNEANEEIIAGKITDSKTISALNMFSLLLKN